MGLATSELVQSCSDCGLSSRYGGICFCRPRWRRSGLGIGGRRRCYRRNSWYLRVSAHQGQRVGM